MIKIGVDNNQENDVDIAVVDAVKIQSPKPKTKNKSDKLFNNHSIGLWNWFLYK